MAAPHWPWRLLMHASVKYQILESEIGVKGSWPHTPLLRVLHIRQLAICVRHQGWYKYMGAQSPKYSSYSLLFC
jgi:hypothetical protein